MTSDEKFLKQLERSTEGHSSDTVFWTVAEVKILIAMVRERDEKLKVATVDFEKLTVRLQTISVRANTYGPGFPESYADGLWRMARDAEEVLARIKGDG